MQPDNFSPMSVIQKLDAMRKQISESMGDMTIGPNDELAKLKRNAMIEGMKFALIWARVEVMAMAFDPKRHAE